LASTALRKASKAAVLPAGLVTRRRPGDLVVLLYHRIGPAQAEIELSAAAFEEHLAYLSERERPDSIGGALGNGRSGGVVVSFDDGSRDFYERALPLLAKYRVPAVLYLATGLVAEERADGDASDALSWGQLREAVSTGLVTVGAHTHSHVNLAACSESTCEDEMRRSKELIEDRLGTECRHFAYPFAVGSPVADRVARRLFDSAALSAWRTNRQGRIDAHRLGRTPVLRSDGPLFFRAKVRGMLDAEASLYRILGRGPWRHL
jgi:peptidoglycan/xylan/chitin deacetylase (PgdA/CDA1 family)